MINHTNSFLKIREEQQRIWDFAILICHAVPALNKTIKGVEHSIPDYSIPKPDYFPIIEDKKRLKALSRHYNANLGKYVVLSLFSFFESYFKSVLNELVDFHGGKEQYLDDTRKKSIDAVSNQDDEIINSKRKLQEPVKPTKLLKYKKYGSLLSSNSSFLFPSELFSSFGLQHLINLLDGDLIKSHQIPELLKSGFHMTLTEKPNNHPELKDMDFEQTFDSMRKIRNRIAHGDNLDIGLKKVSAYSSFIRAFTLKIDTHLVNHFFIIEKYI